MWLFSVADARRIAQQQTGHGQRRLYWYTDLSTLQRDGVPLIQTDLEQYLLTNRAPALFPR